MLSQVRVEAVTLHPDWDAELFTNDIAVLRLERELVFNTAVGPVQMARSRPGSVTRVVVTGWGGVYPHNPNISGNSEAMIAIS